MDESQITSDILNDFFDAILDVKVIQKTASYIIQGIIAVSAGALATTFTLSTFFNRGSGTHLFETVSEFIILAAPILFFVFVVSISTSLLLLKISSTSTFTSTMPEKEDMTELMREPLHETTRKTRRNLLFISLIGFTMTLGGITPKKVDALGIEVTDINKANLLIIAFFIIGYLLLSFSIFVRNDIVNFMIKAPHMKRHMKSNMLLRLWFEAGLPVIVGAFSLTFLLKQIWF